MSAPVFGLDGFLEDIGKGLPRQFRLLLEVYLVDLVLSHGLLGHTKKELDGGGAVDEVAVVKAAAEVSAEEGDDVYNGSAQ